MRDQYANRKINIDDIVAGKDVVAALTDWAIAQPDGMPVMIYASADPQEVKATQQKYGVQRAGEVLEQTLGQLAIHLTAAGFDRLIVAGGETSGAVVSALGVQGLRIGPEIAPGVPWTETLSPHPVALALKSGNFGAETFFDDAFGMLT
ncbi:nucleotide-binding domain containing protein [Sulfitobacter pacificus]|uniref:nucleotide-binding domain containing protein n=1 Tax=Sulfitobacter pacificus TaxID=1499314 RepID=UPI0036212FC5